jgi:hypothetical protein
MGPPLCTLLMFSQGSKTVPRSFSIFITLFIEHSFNEKSKFLSKRSCSHGTPFVHTYGFELNSGPFHAPNPTTGFKGGD